MSYSSEAPQVLIILKSAPALLGAAGLTCQITWPLLRRRRAMLLTQIGIGVFYGLQYFTIGALSAAVIAWIGASQTVSTAIFPGGTAARRLGFIFLPLAVCACILTWSGYVSLLALTACLLVMIARFQICTLRLRMLQLAASPFGIAHDIAMSAWPALTGAVLSLVIASFALGRELRAGTRCE